MESIGLRDAAYRRAARDFRSSASLFSSLSNSAASVCRHPGGARYCLLPKTMAEDLCPIAGPFLLRHRYRLRRTESIRVRWRLNSTAGWRKTQAILIISMCGIVGIFSNDHPVSGELLGAMVARIKHRGPDDSGTWLSQDGRVGLGHARLSIIDLSPAGHQPMSDVEKKLWIVFNGEIYNFQEIRKELEESGC